MLPGLSAAGMMIPGDRKPAFRNLSALFAGGADGIMIDFINKDTLFQDANGALPVVSSGNPVGLVLDQHKWGGLSLAAYRASRPELMTNGTFTTDISGWTQVGSFGTIAWNAGTMEITANAGSTPTASVTVSGLTVGRWYELSVEIVYRDVTTTQGFFVGTSAGSSVTLNGQNIASQPLSTPARRYFKATQTTHYISCYGAGGAGNKTRFDNVSLKEIDGNHAYQAGNSCPIWYSTTNDAAFDGVNDYLNTDFYFRDAGNFLSAYFTRGSTGSTRNLCGAYNTTGGTEAGYLTLNSAGVPIGNIGGGGITSSGGALPSAGPFTLLGDQSVSQADLFLDGALVGSRIPPGDMPDAARGRTFIIGAFNSNGTVSGYFNGNLKRVVAGQVRVQDIMSAADFHANLIAA